jgi:hypothetical protein
MRALLLRASSNRVYVVWGLCLFSRVAVRFVSITVVEGGLNRGLVGVGVCEPNYLDREWLTTCTLHSLRDMLLDKPKHRRVQLQVSFADP